MRDELFFLAFLLAIGALLWRNYGSTISFILGDFSYDRRAALESLNSKREILQEERTELELDLHKYQKQRTKNVAKKPSHIARQLLEVKPPPPDVKQQKSLSQPVPVRKSESLRGNLEQKQKRLHHEKPTPILQIENLSRNELIQQQDREYLESVRIDSEKLASLSRPALLESEFGTEPEVNIEYFLD
jgi:hypothetical protein